MVTDVRRDEAETAYEPDPRRWRILAVTLTIGFMTLLDVTIVNVALPSIRQGLDASAAQVQWIVSGYALTFGLTLVAGGRLGDAYGRRRMMLIGLTGFIVSSAGVGLAPNEWWVVTARLVQGFAAGLLTPQNSGLIQQLFRGPERGRAFGFFGLTVSVSAALGPVLGGLILRGRQRTGHQHEEKQMRHYSITRNTKTTLYEIHKIGCRHLALNHQEVMVEDEPFEGTGEELAANFTEENEGCTSKTAPCVR